MSNQTIGHCANSMGVRGHSAGDIFPATIMIVGTFITGFEYHILNHPRLTKEYPYGNYEAAHMAAQCTSRF